MKDVYTIADLRDWPHATADCTPPLRLAVIGDPVAHSASPPMHNAALAALGLPARYTRLHIRPEELAEALALLPGAGFIGINCTIPHKGPVLPAVHSRDLSAELAGGVNTVVVQPDGQLRGYSTDGAGLSRAVREAFGVELATQRVLILGAGGGAGRAVAIQCASEKCARLVLMNRTLPKLSELVEKVETLYPRERLTVAAMENSALKAQLALTDLVIHCTSLGMKADDLSPISADLLEARHCLYDTIYVGTRTPLQRAADSVGARSANGLTMLLHQGAISFEHWFQQPAPIEVMRAALLAHLSEK